MAGPKSPQSTVAGTSIDPALAGLKELVESWRAEDRRAFEEYKATTEKALVKQAEEYERRLIALNGEQARIALSQATFVSRELWDRFQIEDRTWKNAIDVKLTDYVTKVEFQARKEGVDKQLLTSTGVQQGSAKTLAILLSILTAASALFGIWALFRK